MIQLFKEYYNDYIVPYWDDVKECDRISRLQDLANVDIPTETM